MYAVPAPMVATSLHHCPSELRYHSADDTLNVAYFVADSKSAPGKVNVIGLDVLTGESHCSCKASEVGRACWHASLIQAAWDGHRARLAVLFLTDAQLATMERKAASMCRQYRDLCGRCLPDDALTLLACRSEALARQAVETLPIAAGGGVVAAPPLTTTLWLRRSYAETEWRDFPCKSRRSPAAL